jgi:hypothetical protein
VVGHEIDDVRRNAALFGLLGEPATERVEVVPRSFALERTNSNPAAIPCETTLSLLLNSVTFIGIVCLVFPPFKQC